MSGQKKIKKNTSGSEGIKENVLGIVVEIFSVIIIMGGVYLIGLIIGRAEIGLLSIAAGWCFIWILLRIQKKDWGGFGFAKPDHWGKTILAVMIWLIFFQIVIGWILKPWVIKLTGRPLDISEFEILRGNFSALLRGLVIVWTIAAFGEEMVFRGYFLNRIEDVFRSKIAGLIIAVLASSLFFGLGHIYQGISGLILASMAGIIYSLAFIFSGRNLWVPILVHGFYDTWAFLALFLGIENRINPFII